MEDEIVLEWRDDMNENAKFLRDRRARNLRKVGYKVKVETISFVDLGRFTLYRLTAYRGKIKC